MRLLINTVDSTDNTSDKNWEEFKYIVNRETASDTTMALERSTGGWNWEKIGDANYTANGKVLQIEIPRAYLGQDGSTIKFNFKWADNNLTDGDTAPEATSVTTDSITLVLKQVDSESGIDESKTKYRLLKDKEGKTEVRTWQNMD